LILVAILPTANSRESNEQQKQPKANGFPSFSPMLSKGGDYALALYSTAMWKRLIWFLAAITVTVSTQVSADTAPFTDDEIAIYRDFLIHYPEQLSNMIGMQDTTVAFVASIAYGPEPDPPNLEIPACSGRKLPPEVMVLTGEKAVTERIAAEGKLVDPKKISPYQGPDGYVRTHLTLSEIAFDSKHELAAFIFSASCRCKGGQGGTVVYELKNGRWERRRPLLNYWIG
jgi:hypothetical protein